MPEAPSALAVYVEPNGTARPATSVVVHDLDDAERTVG